jgi:hypothetical protein
MRTKIEPGSHLFNLSGIGACSHGVCEPARTVYASLLARCM